MYYKIILNYYKKFVEETACVIEIALEKNDCIIQ